MPSFMWISTVSSNLARLTDLSRLMAFFSGTGPSLLSRWAVFLSWLRSFLPRRGATPGFLLLLGRGCFSGRLPAAPAGALAGARRRSSGGSRGAAASALGFLAALLRLQTLRFL